MSYKIATMKLKYYFCVEKLSNQQEIKVRNSMEAYIVLSVSKIKQITK